MKIPYCLCGLLMVCSHVTAGREHARSITTASGSAAPRAFSSGDLIFEDNFDVLDLETWSHENTLGGGGNWEFQWYSNNRTNSYVTDGKLSIKPSLLSAQYGEAFLSSGTLNVHGNYPVDMCTNEQFFGCERTGTTTNYLNPIKSARLRTVESFSFRYGRVEARAKMPTGDWLWPAIWLMPANNAYGTWPSSGEIDLVESRGNRNLVLDGVNIGVKQVSSTLHFGPFTEWNRYSLAHFKKNSDEGYNARFHRYQLEWTLDYISFSIDDEETGRITPSDGGFWQFGGYDNSTLLNPWRYGTKMAPFDQKFYLIINLAVGGVNFFSDNATNPSPKPWLNSSPTANRDFWNAKGDWLPTWDLEGSDNATLQVDYVRVWAL